MRLEDPPFMKTQKILHVGNSIRFRFAQLFRAVKVHHLRQCGYANALHDYIHNYIAIYCIRKLYYVWNILKRISIYVWWNQRSFSWSNSETSCRRMKSNSVVSCVAAAVGGFLLLQMMQFCSALNGKWNLVENWFYIKTLLDDSASFIFQTRFASSMYDLSLNIFKLSYFLLKNIKIMNKDFLKL